MRKNNELQPSQKMRSPFVAKVLFWNDKLYQNRFPEWNFRSDMCPNIHKNSTIQNHLEELINFLKTDIAKNYGYEMITIFENMNLLTQYDGECGIKKNIVLQCSQTTVFYDNRDRFNFENIIKNNDFYMAESWNEEVMMISLNKQFIERMKISFSEQAVNINSLVQSMQNVYENYRKTWLLPYPNHTKIISN